MSRPRCIRCNRPILEGQPRHSRMNATARAYWHAREADCIDTGLRERAPTKGRDTKGGRWRRS